MHVKALLAVLLAGALSRAYSQVVAPTDTPGLPLTIGVGYSNFDSDFSGRISGTSLWITWSFDDAPSYLKHLGIDVEARDLSYGRTGNDPKLRFDTFAAGPIYKFHPYRKILLYPKFLGGFGSMDFTSSNPSYSHDTRAFYAPGGGVDYRISRALWVRGDYEYQFWPDFFQYKTLNPNGFTIGMFYDFRRR